MRKLLITLIVLIVSVIRVHAQDVTSSKIDSLAEDTKMLKNIVRKLDRFKVSAYIQGQYQYGQEDASLKVGAGNEHENRSFNRFGIRRGRIKFQYTDEIATGVIQLEVNDKGVSFRDLYIGVKDPWTKRNEVLAGVFNRPFGHEVNYSTSNLESPERATVIQLFFPNERDLGAMLTLRAPKTSPLNFLRLDAGIFAGNSINMDTDSRKDFIGRLRADNKIANWGEWGLGVSYYYGHVYNPTTEEYVMEGPGFVKIQDKAVGSYMKREYVGFDGQFGFFNPLGRTTLRAEMLFGTQPGIAGSTQSPNYSKRPDNTPDNALFKRNFTGYFFYLIHDIGNTPFSFIAKYDAYDPNIKVHGDKVGIEGSYTSKTDLAQSTVGLGALWRINKHLRLQTYFEFNTNEKSKNVAGYEGDRKDNVLTVRLQYKF